jgi:hypothetical protein
VRMRETIFLQHVEDEARLIHLELSSKSVTSNSHADIHISRTTSNRKMSLQVVHHMLKTMPISANC